MNGNPLLRSSSTSLPPPPPPLPPLPPLPSIIIEGNNKHHYGLENATTATTTTSHSTTNSSTGGNNNNNNNNHHSDDVVDRITRLRIFLQHKPNNARAMAKLACLIASQQQQQHPSVVVVVAKDPNVLNEAIEWAERSIAAAPTKPYGHTALSILHPQFHVRMNALRRALQTCTSGDENNDRYSLVQMDLLVRLLLEPRAEQRRRRVLNGDPTTPQQVVTKEERVVMAQIDAALDLVWNRHRKNNNNNNEPQLLDNDTLEFLGQREYRLGRFFRKLEPTNVYRPKSQWYFEQAIQHLPPHHADQTMAQFWRATLVLPPLTPLHTTNHDINDDDNNNGVARLSSTTAWTKCPAEYIVGLYATFAPTFDELLVEKLEYETPRMLRILHDRALEPQRRSYRAMADLGCGTGLSGLAFASLLGSSRNDGDDDTTAVGTMTGVDLSPEMLVLAAQKKCYQRLVTGDIASILQEPAVWDCVLACDVFCYIGDLMPVFCLVHASLMPDGIFVFSNEKASDEFDAPFYLHECARFAHRKDYIVSLAEGTGFQILTMQVCPIRKNKGKDVIGILSILRKLST